MSRHLILGTAGHIDHGKTTLIRALTGTDTDRLPEEKRRGITIEPGFAELPVGEDTTLGVVDVPGHEAFIRQMLAGATGIDLVMLVVAADEGVMPQTREHLAIVELLGVRGAVVALTKCDAVEPAWLELVIEDLREQLSSTPFAEATIVPCSGRTGEGLDELRSALDAAASAVPDRAGDDLFRMPVDRSFTVRGTGTVVTGTVWSGRVPADGTLRLLPADRAVRVRGVQVHGREREDARAGERAALALAGVDRAEVRRGDILVNAAGWGPSRMLTARVRLLAATDWRLRHRQRVRVHLGTAEVLARVALLDAAEAEPGIVSWAQLRLEEPLVARAGDRFVLRSYSPVTTIGGGIVAEPRPPKRKRLEPGVAESLRAILDEPADAALEALLRLRGWRGVERDSLPVLLPAAGSIASTEPAGQRLFAPEVVDRARRRVLSAVRDLLDSRPLQPAAPWEVARRSVPAQAAPELAERAIAELVREGALEARDEGLAPPDHAPAPSPDQAVACEALLSALDRGGLAPPTIPELEPTLRARADLEELIAFLLRRGDVTRLGPDLLVATPVLERAVAVLRERLGGRAQLSPADFRAVFPELTRKYLIPLLEHLDARGVTRRAGEGREVV